MMKKKKGYKIICLTLILLAGAGALKAQFTLTGELRPRAELRDGQGTLLSKNAVPSFFISQRARIKIGYTGKRFRFFTTIQDTRVWGQDRSTINRNTTDPNDGIMLHEAWGELIFADTANSRLQNLSLKMGRQELVYDDERLLGSLNWLQQGRRHDLALLKFENKGWTAHAGFAYNQNAEFRNQPKSGDIYNPVPDQTYTGANTIYPAGTNGIGEMYKTLDFIYISRQFSFGKPSFLFLNDNFSRYHYARSDSLKVNPVFESGAWGRMTTGVYLPFIVRKKLYLTASAYYQFGKDKSGAELSDYLLSLYTTYVFNSKFSAGPGVDYTSGRFDPLYGTPHKFWGYMDYFYAADPFSANGARNGLIDYYVKTRYTPIAKLFFTADVHQFFLPDKITDAAGKPLSRNLGTETDIVGTYNITKDVSMEGGYGSMFATPVMAAAKVKNVSNAALQANWAYLMVTFRPDFLSKK